jgi:hypothetical protein
MWSLFLPGKHSLQFLLALSLLVTGLMLLQTGIASAGQYAAPDLDGFKLHDERDADGDGDGVNETHIRHYLNQSGDSIVSMTIRDRLWAWSLDTHDNDSGVHNYVIRDSNCDGVFDEVYGLDDEFHVPDCLK